MRDAAIRAPEREAVIEGASRFIRELDVPVRAAIFRLIDAKISGVVPDGHEISDSIAYALDIAELQTFGSRNDSGSPRRTAIGRDHIRATGSGRPHHSGVHWTDGNQQLRRAALLWNKSGSGLMMTFPCFLCIPATNGGKQENEQRKTL